MSKLTKWTSEPPSPVNYATCHQTTSITSPRQLKSYGLTHQNSGSVPFSTEQYGSWLIYVPPGARRQWRQPLNPAAVAKPLAQRCRITCSKSPKSLEVVDFCWDLPSHIAKHRYLQHFRPKMQLYLAAGGGLQAKVAATVSTDKKRYRWWVAALSCRRNALQSHHTS